MSARIVAAVVAAGALAFMATPAGARPLPVPAAKPPVQGGCPPVFADLRARADAEATRRETTLADVSAKLSAAQDPWGLNGGLLATFADARNALEALDQRIRDTCYPTRDAIRSDVVSIFTAYRVYWLRVPQAHLIEEADHLGVARGKLQTVAQTLAGLVGANAAAQRDLAAMRSGLAAFDATLGTVPHVTVHLAAVAQLAPAADMTADVAAMQSARSDLRSARQSLGQASLDAHKVIKDLGR